MAVQTSSLKQSKREITSNYKSCERKRAGGRENIGKREKGRREGRRGGEREGRGGDGGGKSERGYSLK